MATKQQLQEIKALQDNVQESIKDLIELKDMFQIMELNDIKHDIDICMISIKELKKRSKAKTSIELINKALYLYNDINSIYETKLEQQRIEELPTNENEAIETLKNEGIHFTNNDRNTGFVVSSQIGHLTVKDIMISLGAKKVKTQKQHELGYRVTTLKSESFDFELVAFESLMFGKYQLEFIEFVTESTDTTDTTESTESTESIESIELTIEEIEKEIELQLHKVDGKTSISEITIDSLAGKANAIIMSLGHMSNIDEATRVATNIIDNISKLELTKIYFQVFEDCFNFDITQPFIDEGDYVLYQIDIIPDTTEPTKPIDTTKSSPIAKVGDIVKANDISATIAKIFYQDFNEGQWDIEFVDTNEIYRHWKSCFDGGVIVRPIKDTKDTTEPTESTESSPIAKVGDTVQINGSKIVIASIITQIYHNGKWDIEFYDTEQKYHRWLQHVDGGDLFPATNEKRVNLFINEMDKHINILYKDMQNNAKLAYLEALFQQINTKQNQKNKDFDYAKDIYLDDKKYLFRNDNGQLNYIPIKQNVMTEKGKERVEYKKQYNSIVGRILYNEINNQNLCTTLLLAKQLLLTIKKNHISVKRRLRQLIEYIELNIHALNIIENYNKVTAKDTLLIDYMRTERYKVLNNDCYYDIPVELNNKLANMVLINK